MYYLQKKYTFFTVSTVFSTFHQAAYRCFSTMQMEDMNNM